jgi:ABC-2 type transport system permease protein
MRAMIVKEFRQLRRDRRTLALLIMLPVLLLIVFGYAASFNVTRIPTAVVGPESQVVVARLRAPFAVTEIDPSAGRGYAVSRLRDGHAAVAFVTGPAGLQVLLDGSQLFSANAARTALGEMARQPGTETSARVEVLFNPQLKTSAIMVPGLGGLILLFIGTMITSLGVVRERQAGTLEQLAVMPFRPRDVFIGKIAPYFLVAMIDLCVVLAIGVALFGVPFRGSVAALAAGSLLYLFVTLGIGVLISTVSQNQGQAIQLAMMTTLPQILLSGLIFPLASMAAGVRWISYLLPLRYFTEISRGIMLRGESIAALWQSFALLALLGVVVVTLATLRFRRDLAPAPRHRVRRLQAEAAAPAGSA